MSKLIYAQGDVLIEALWDTTAHGACDAPTREGSSQEVLPQEGPAHDEVVLAEGEVTGHRHVISHGATLFRDDGLARDIPEGLYIGHVRVDAPSARVQHEEHDPIDLPRGVYRVRRQRELEPKDARLVSD